MDPENRGMEYSFFLIYGYLICALNSYFFFEHLTFPDTEISVFGIAVAILLGFRNNETYNRFWEARSAWGDLTNVSRNFASQLMGYIQPPGEQEHIRYPYIRKKRIFHPSIFQDPFKMYDSNNHRLILVLS